MPLSRVDLEAVRVFLEIYEANHSALTDAVYAEAMSHPGMVEFADRPVDERRREDEAAMLALKVAVTTANWEPLLQLMRSNGATYHAYRATLALWMHLISAFRSAASIIICEQVSDDLRIKALRGLGEFLDVALLGIYEGYHSAERQAALREALELNDNVVQGLVVAKMALALDEKATTAYALNKALTSAQSVIGTLLANITDLVPADLVRQEPADG
jgi:hypothetical protein